MIFYSWGRKALPLAEMGIYPCPRCQASRHFRAVLSYRYFKLYWLFGVVTSRRTMAACSICNQGVAVEKSQLPFSPAAISIPFMDQWGLAIFGGILAVVIAAAMAKH